MDFCLVQNNNSLVGLFKNAAMKKPVHSVILNGLPGSGKKTAAKELALLLACNNPDGLKGCGKCLVCKMIKEGASPDFMEIRPDGASIKVEQIRDIRNDIIKMPVYSEYKSYIIYNACKMTVQAQNCLLKTLEEPPEYAVIILVLENYEAVIQTIRSRCIKVDFISVSKDILISWLVKKGVQKDKAELAAAYSGGIPGKALSIIKDDGFSNKRIETFKAAEKIISKEIDITWLEDFFNQNRDDIDRILNILFGIIRDCIAAKEGVEQKILINEDKRDIIRGIIRQFTTGELLRIFYILKNFNDKLKRTGINYKMLVSEMIFEFWRNMKDGKSCRDKV